MTHSIIDGVRKNSFKNLWSNILFKNYCLSARGSRSNLSKLWIKCGQARTSIYDLAFVHGNEEELTTGKTCVIRNRRIELEKGELVLVCEGHEGGENINEEKMQSWRKVEKPKYKTVLVREGKLLFIGQTGSGNSKIKLFTIKK